MNHTTKYGLKYPVAYSRWHFDPSTIGFPPSYDVSSYGWVRTHDTFSHPEFLLDKMRYHDTYDLPKWSLPCMQDLIKTKVDSFFEVEPTIRYRYYNIGITGDVIGLQDAYVANHMVNSLTGSPVNAETLVPTSTLDMYSRLAASPITLSIPELKSDSDFSIWYLIKDMMEAPRLIKDIFPSIARMSSVVGKDGNRSLGYLERVINSASPNLKLPKKGSRVRKGAAVRQLLKQEQRFTGGVTLKQLAHSHLAITYGLLPTIADIRDFADVMLKWYSRWRARQHGLGRLETYYAPVRVLSQGSEQAPFAVNFPVFGDAIGNGDVVVSTGNMLLHQTTKFYFVCPELTSTMQAFVSLIDEWGILDPAVIWDAIPYSFVIDWFVDVTSFLHRNFKPHFLPIDMVICDWCESIHRKSTIDITLRYSGVSNLNLGPERMNIGEKFLTLDVYQIARKRQFPHPLKIDTAIQWGTGLGVRRIINGSAVIVNGHTRAKSHSSNYRNRES